ncbi:biotin/lipoyl-binding protein, partial [Candidatus Woesearchaeota archaeon]|nr:biotin/lipoyl-binding protein [Candidatus Woesearchaeota archaeon]
MNYEFKFPDVGEGIAEGEIVKWHVKEKDFVKKDQVIAEIETDKAIVQMPSPKEGVILRLNKPEGAKIKVGEILAVISDSKD